MFSWATITSAVLGLIKGIVTLFNRSVEWFKEKRLIRMGRELEAAERAKQEIDINRQQTEILSQPETKEETEKKLRDAKF